MCELMWEILNIFDLLITQNVTLFEQEKDDKVLFTVFTYLDSVCNCDIFTTIF